MKTAHAGHQWLERCTNTGNGVAHNVNFWCTPDWKWHRPWSTASAGENVAGFVSSGLNGSEVVLRPWAPVGWGTVLSPAPLSGNVSLPYNVGACQFSPIASPLRAFSVPDVIHRSSPGHPFTLGG